jgi:UDP-N-acetylglucosamine acyltransferase
MSIHPTAIINKRSHVDPSSDVGPYAIIESDVTIGPDVRIYGHAYVAQFTTIDSGCQIHPFAVVGHVPQDTAHKDEESFCQVGSDTVIREGATVHRGTAPGSTTRIGRAVYLMANSHVAHNCVVGSKVTITNGALLGGHVEIGDGAFISGNLAVHQFVRIGQLAMVTGVARIPMDIPPYFMTGHSGKCVGVNIVGMRRADFSREQIQDVRDAYRTLYRSGHRFRDALTVLSDQVHTDPGREIVAFLRAPSRRGIAGRQPPIADSDDD